MALAVQSSGKARVRHQRLGSGKGLVHRGGSWWPRWCATPTRQSLRNGEFDLAIDLEAARTWYQEAAEGGVTIAQRILGWAYQDGDLGVAINYETTRMWLHKAAEGGDGPRNGGLEWLTREAS